MIPKYYRPYDPTGRCPLSTSKEIVKEVPGAPCPCGDANCQSEREYIGFVNGVTNGKASLVYGVVGAVVLLLLLLTVLGGENKLNTALEQFGAKATDLESQVQSLEASASKTRPQTKPLDLQALKSKEVELRAAVLKAIHSKDSALVEAAKTSVNHHQIALQGQQRGPVPNGASADTLTSAKRLAQATRELKNEASETLEPLFTKYPSEVPRAEDFLSTLDSLQGRLSRLSAPASSSGSTGASAQESGAVQASLAVMADLKKSLDAFLPPPPVPFTPEQADFVVYVPTSHAQDLAEPLVKAWAGADVITSADGNTYLTAPAHGKVLIQSVDQAEGFALLASNPKAIFLSDRSPTPDEKQKLGSDYSENRSVAEVIALDALTFLVHPQSELSTVVADRLPSLKLLGGASPSIKTHAEAFQLPVASYEAKSAEEIALANPQIVSLGLYHDEGDNLRAKRLAIQASAETLVLKPSPFALATEDYLYTFRIIAWSPATATDAALSLVKFATSNEGQEIVAKQGYMDLRLSGQAQDGIPPEILAAIGGAIGSPTVSSAVRLSTNIRFETGKATLDLKAQADIERLPKFVFDKYPTHKVVIMGYTDNVGGPNVNMPLSKQRADSVAVELKRSKLDANGTGLGSVFPVDSNETELGKAKNRRAEVWVARP